VFINFCYWASAVLVFTPGVVVGQDSFLVKPNATWSYHAAVDAPADNWQASDFRETTWPQGKAGFGYGDDDDATELTNMRGRFTQVQIRTDFVISDVAKANDLYLYVSYDDGFVAYINGREIARANVVEPNGGVAAGNHEIAGFERFDIRNARTLLKTGRNVLAVEGFNRSADSSDLSLHPALSTRPAAIVQSFPTSLDGQDLSAEPD
jgi:acid phosphatase type 7